jgi:hypothetical protein
MRGIGMISYTDDVNGSGSAEGVPSDFKEIVKYAIFGNADTCVGKINDEWIAQTCFMVDIDDFAVIKMYFEHLPSKDEIRTAFTVRKFDYHPIEIFRCWECGNLTHWLELDGDI